MILLKINRGSNTPIFRQIYQQLRDMIENRTLPYGYRMPSTRALATKHGLNRSTVYKAYEELWAMGFIESRPGSYSIVRHRQNLASPNTKSCKELHPWRKKFPPEVESIHQSFRQVNYAGPGRRPLDIINLASLDIDPRLFPSDEFRKTINAVIIQRGGEVFRYGESQGYRPLRETIASRLRTHGISVTSREILITNGSQNSIELVIKTLTTAGSEVVIESPTYSHALPLFSFYKNKVVQVPMNRGGMDLNHLRSVLSTHRPAFIYTMPNFHNPTGITTDHRHREQLLQLADEFHTPIVEDAFEEEMKYFGKVPLPIKSMDNKNLVVYLGTFSKIFAPGIRIGWIAAGEELIERILAVKKFSDLSSNNLIQSALDRFCRQGGYDRHIKRIHREYRKRLSMLINQLREKFKDLKQVSWHEPSGGYLTWVHLHGTDLTDDQVQNLFLNHGVAISMGGAYFPDNRCRNISKIRSENAFRISISSLNSKEIETGVNRLRAAISQIYGTE